MRINMRRHSYFIIYSLVFVITESIRAAVPGQSNLAVIVAAQTNSSPKSPSISGWSDPATVTVGQNPDGSAVLPCDQIITPAGRQVTFPDRPLDLMLSPDGRWLVVTTSHSILVINPLTGEVKSLRLPSGRANSFHGILFYPDSRTVYSAGNNGALEVVKIDDQGQPLLQAPWQLGKKALSGVAKSPDGQYLFTADTTANSLIVAGFSSRQFLGRIPLGIAPYAVAVGPDRRIYVSNMGGQNPTGGMIVARTCGSSVAVDPETDVPLAGAIAVIKYPELTTNLNTEIKCPPPEFIEVGRIPGHMIVNPGGTQLFVVNANDDTVSVIDLKANKVMETISVRPAINLPFGSQPSALAISPDGKRIYVANAGNNAVAVVKLGKAAGVAGGEERSSITGYIPVGWMPGALQISPDGRRLYVANVRGLGSIVSPKRGGFRAGEVLGLVCIIDIPPDSKLAEYSRQVMDNNRQIYALSNFRPRRADDRLVPVPTRPGESSVFKHVIYIIRENHTYDQDFGDFEKGNGDPRFCSCDATVTPNARAIAGQFVLLDNYHVPSDQSPSGHLWLSQAINTLYYEKALGQWPRGYSYEGRDALAFAGSSFIWVNAVKHGLTFRNYGEAVSCTLKFSDCSRSGNPQWRDAWYDYQHNTSSVTIKATGNLHSNRKYTCPDYPGYTYVIPDVRRAQIFINELKEYEAQKYFPDFVLIWLPNNHTCGSAPGLSLPTAPAQVADNDQALGMIVDAVSHSVFWPETVVFTTEDDPANGTDHVAGSRSICLTASPYTKRGRVISTCYSMIGLIKTIELILGLPMMNQLDLAARPMTDCFAEKPDFSPYTYIPSKIPLDQITPSLSALKGEDLFWARQSMTLPLTESEDAFLDEADPNKTALFQQVFWHAMVGNRKPYAIITEQGEVVVAQTNICNRLFFLTQKEKK